MERVVYLLGAGFSAPLGLPVMSNFLEKSKDLYFAERARYGHFAKVFEEIAKMSVVKNYYSTDLSNIEEILSVLAMQEGLKGRQLEEIFLTYIADVINHYTPRFPPQSNWPANWPDVLFSTAGANGKLFGNFVANLLHLRISAAAGGSPPLRASSFKGKVDYAVVTLNYDLVLENFVQYIDETFGGDQYNSFGTIAADSEAGNQRRCVPLAKLHGSADTKVIVAPTWSKSLAEGILPAWKTAFIALSQANYIRIIGYSLPAADAYIKYLLRAAAIESPHLKRIDVLCKEDRRRSVHQRYAELIDSSKFRFVDCDVVEYLASLAHDRRPVLAESFDFERLESIHDDFVGRRAV